MKTSLALLALGLVLGMVATVAASPASLWDIDDARSAVKLEIGVDKNGAYNEIEYHIEPDRVPAAVKAAMDKLHPGGPFVAAERERNNGQLYFELSREVNGYEVEAMFTPEGKLHSEEVTVAADKVPDAVKQSIAQLMPTGKVTAWEEIRNGERELTAYHVKVAADGKNWKLALSTAGAYQYSVIEVPAEIEVPTPLR